MRAFVHLSGILISCSLLGSPFGIMGQSVMKGLSGRNSLSPGKGKPQVKNRLPNGLIALYRNALVAISQALLQLSSEGPDSSFLNSQP